MDPLLSQRLDAPQGLECEQTRTTLLSSIRKVFESLGTGRRESVYQCALKHELQQTLGETAILEYPIPIFYEGERVGVSYLDILLLKRCFIEVKATSKIGGKDVLQTKAYARDSGLLGALVNFKQTPSGGFEIVYVNGKDTLSF